MGVFGCKCYCTDSSDRIYAIKGRVREREKIREEESDKISRNQKRRKAGKEEVRRESS